MAHHLTQFLAWLRNFCGYVLSIVSLTISILVLVLFRSMVIVRFTDFEEPLNNAQVPQPTTNTQLKKRTKTISAPSTNPGTKHLIPVPNGTNQLLYIPLAQVPTTLQLPISPSAQTTAQSSMVTSPHDTQSIPSSNNDIGSDGRRIVSSVSSTPSVSSIPSRLFASAIPSSSASSVYSMLSASSMSSRANTAVENTSPSTESHHSTTLASLVSEFDSMISTLDTNSIDRAVSETEAWPAHRPSMQYVPSPAPGTSPNTSLPQPTPAITNQLLNQLNTQHPTSNPAIQGFIDEDGPWSSEDLYVSDRRNTINRFLDEDGPWSSEDL